MSYKSDRRKLKPMRYLSGMSVKLHKGNHCWRICPAYRLFYFLFFCCSRLFFKKFRNLYFKFWKMIITIFADGLQVAVIQGYTSCPTSASNPITLICFSDMELILLNKRIKLPEKKDTHAIPWLLKLRLSDAEFCICRWTFWSIGLLILNIHLLSS